jgi:Straboviridae DNA topoisomerase large subunit
MKKNKKYTGADIQVLTDQQHVRKRLSMYTGSIDVMEYKMPNFTNNTFLISNVVFVPAALKVCNEIFDNSVDELLQISKKNKKIQIIANNTTGEYQVTDNGRGVPIDIHPITKRYTAETVFCTLRSGRNFGDDNIIGTIGMNGLGSSLTNFVSDYFNIDIYRDNKHYHQTFTNGATKISKPVITDVISKTTGTTISFKLDPTVFSNVIIPEEVMHNRAIEIAFNNPDVIVEYNTNTYRYKQGLSGIVNSISNKYFSFSNEFMDFNVIFDLSSGVDEQIYTYVNGSFLWEGGICNIQFCNAFYDKTIAHLSKEAKKQKCEITKNDIRTNLLVLGTLKLTNPNFDSQAKTRLTGPTLRKEFDNLINQHWPTFIRKNKEWLDEVLARAFERHHIDANKKAQKDHLKILTKKVPGLIDATSKDRSKCMLFLTEGDSAKFSLQTVRIQETMAMFALTGKINNVYGHTIAEVLQMGKLTNLLAAIGLTPGKKAIRDQLRYGDKIIIAADADVDGADIVTLVINLFYQFWPELYDPNDKPYIHRLIVPNVCLTKGNKRIHFATRQQYETNRNKYPGWTVTYYKGLGSMVEEDWELIAKKLDDFLIPIVDDGLMSNALTLAFDENTNNRKIWLQPTM